MVKRLPSLKEAVRLPSQYLCHSARYITLSCSVGICQAEEYYVCRKGVTVSGMPCREGTVWDLCRK